VTWYWIIFALQVVALCLWIVATIALFLAAREFKHATSGSVIFPDARFRAVKPTKPEDP
jgi:hypothetical protein